MATRRPKKVPARKAAKTEAEIVEGCNELARLFYKSLGYQVPDGFKFYEAHHPQEVGVWNMAVMAYDHIADTDVENALLNLDDEDE
jgi:hypothetical protein